MAKFCLLSALTVSDFGDPELTLSANQETYPPIGILSLAAVLIEGGENPQIVDLNKLFYEFLRNSREPSSSNFLIFVVQQLECLSFEVLGLSTICSSYPLTLRIAEEIKRLHPNVQIILGWPQASIVDVPTLSAYPFIDFIVRGEAEDAFPLLLESLFDKDTSIGLESIPGITFRRDGKIVRNPNAPPIMDLDRLPLPAYHLDPDIKKYKSISLESGRGCPFNCSFCSTNDFFGRRFRLKSTQKLIEQMEYINDEFGINEIDFSHDNFTVNRNRIIEFCEALLKCGRKFKWSCSSRTDRIDDEMIALMARSGCYGIFFGIETGSARSQQLINKNLNLSDATERIKCANQHGIEMDISFITAFPDETKEDLRDTVHYIIDLLRFKYADPQLGLLTPLAGTHIHSMYKDKIVLDNIFSDMSFQGWKIDPVDFLMIKANPEVFPNFYSVPTYHLSRRYFKEVRDFTVALCQWFRWLPLALIQSNGDMLDIFDKWELWKASADKPNDNVDHNDISMSYYFYSQFFTDFLKFIQGYYSDENITNKAVISAVIDIEKFLHYNKNDPVIIQTEQLDVFSLSSFPYLPGDLHIVQLNVDYKSLLDCLINKKSLEQVSFKNVTIAFQDPSTNPGQMEIEVRQLDSLSEKLLNMCDGSRTVSDIIHEFSLLNISVNGVSAEKACFYGLGQLFKQGLIQVCAHPIERDSIAGIIPHSNR